MINSLKLLAYGPLSIRIVIGILFVIAGWQKLSNLPQTQGYFVMMGLPQEIAVLIGLLELIGGILLIFGLLTRIVASLFIVEMIGGIIISEITNAVALPAGFELSIRSIPFIYLAICITLLLTGPGKISLELNVLKREMFPIGMENKSNLIE